MQMTSVTLPDLEALAVGLKSALATNGYGGCQVTILNREANLYVSTFASETVTCRIDDSELQLFCKYGADYSDEVYGHKSAVAYEAEVYRQVLRPLPGCAPRFYGSYSDRKTGQTWLILEHLEGSARMNETPHPAAERLAAGWLGRFHAACEARLARTPIPFLTTYDAEYYVGWARRTSRLAGDFHRRFPWLRIVCERFEGLVPALLTPRPTVVHGEFYPHNVLIRDEAVYPIDWESAAVATGEIDLASLTENWPAEALPDFQLDYQKARWPEGAPPEFERVLDAARFYWAFRWLGDESNCTRYQDWVSYLKPLYAVGERLGLI